jgi:hypothetical protein
VSGQKWNFFSDRLSNKQQEQEAINRVEHPKFLEDTLTVWPSTVVLNGPTRYLLREAIQRRSLIDRIEKCRPRSGGLQTKPLKLCIDLTISCAQFHWFGLSPDLSLDVACCRTWPNRLPPPSMDRSDGLPWL